jgi:hypothetical protein
LLQCNSQSDLWHEQAVVVHLGFDGRDDHAPPGRGECRSGGRAGETSVPPRPAANVMSRSKPLCLSQAEAAFCAARSTRRR